jgi:CRP-like cAMP-binding protein
MATLEVFRNDPNARPFYAGDVIFEDGSTTHDEMYVVVDGQVDIITHGRHVETVGPGGIFGEMALVDRGPRSASAIAKTDGKLVAINEKRFLYLVGNTPYFALEVMRTLATRVRHMNEAIEAAPGPT